MKKFFFSAACTFLGLVFSFTVTAQTKVKTCDWVSDKGFWVVESNQQTPRNAIVYFYNNDRMLVYKEELHNQLLKLTKKKTLYRLKAALEQAIELSTSGAWASHVQLVKNSLQD